MPDLHGWMGGNMGAVKWYIAKHLIYASPFIIEGVGFGCVLTLAIRVWM